MLELMARGCMRVGEVLKLTPMDIEDRKATVRAPKSGSEVEVVFLPQKVADRLKKYIHDNGIKPGDRIFPIIYADAGSLSLRVVNWSAFKLGLMICAGTPPPMPVGQGPRLKSSARCC